MTKGRAKCVVTMTGMTTELGKIAEALEKKDAVQERGFRLFMRKIKIALGLANTTPLQIKLNSLAYWLLLAAIILAIIVVSSTGYHNIPPSIATYAVAAAVSLLPASLIAVVSLTLAVACRELAARNALVRRMDAVETLYVNIYLIPHVLIVLAGEEFITFALTRLVPSQLDGWWCVRRGFL